VVVQSGVNVILDEAQHKQLLKNLPYVKEAFFSKVVILVEGDTELGAIPNFSERMDVELDEFGISVIEAGGADSIPSLMKLLDEFGIQNIALMDSDKKQSYINVANLSFTQGQDFEEDIYENFDLIDYVKYLEAEFPNENKANFLIGKAKKEDITLNHQDISNQLEFLSKDEVQKLKESSKEDILKSMRKSKSILDGADLGKHVTNIPQVYKDLINKAVELSKIC
jgi:putative ATP-dependent endonuclease of OLD family